MTIRKDVIEAIGNTPLIKLKRASEQTCCTTLAKAESGQDHHHGVVPVETV